MWLQFWKNNKQVHFHSVLLSDELGISNRLVDYTMGMRYATWCNMFYAWGAPLRNWVNVSTCLSNSTPFIKGHMSISIVHTIPTWLFAIRFGNIMELLRVSPSIIAWSINLSDIYHKPSWFMYKPTWLHRDHRGHRLAIQSGYFSMQEGRNQPFYYGKIWG